MSKKISVLTALAAAIVLGFTVYGGQRAGGSDFSIYGTWEYVVTPNSFHEWTVAPPYILIRGDNTVEALIYETRYTGTLFQISKYHFEFEVLTSFSEGDYYDVEEGTISTLVYDPIAQRLRYDGNSFINMSNNLEVAAAIASAVRDSFTDPRDGQVYRTVEVDGLTWMAQNLNFPTDSSWCFSGCLRSGFADDEGNTIYFEDTDDPNCEKYNCETYGRLYSWDAAMNACPPGRRLPTDDEWSNFVRLTGGFLTAGTTLKKEYGWEDWDGMNGNGYDCLGFSALPSGYRSVVSWTNVVFWNIGEHTNWWSSTDGDHANTAWARGISHNSTGVNRGTADKGSYAVSVRCVKE
jgi:uncharacterized protein (TIGR02145 family)